MKKFLRDLELASKWSMENFSDLPWRKSRSFYRTLISEVMLQQTTVATVKNRFNDFIKKFPNLKTLSNANDEDLLKAWQGLGYYSRAIRLKVMASELDCINQNKLNVDDLKKIKGIGDYTANALLAIGLNKSALALDVNIERVLYRYFGINYLSKEKGSGDSKAFLKERLLKLMPKEIQSYRQLHETLMDVGRVFCQARKMSCIQCSMKINCKTYKENYDYYQKIVEVKGKKSLKEKAVLARFLIIKNNQILLVKRQKNQWLAGQWELPTYVIEGLVPEVQYRKLTFKLEDFENIGKLKSTITKYQFENILFRWNKKSNNMLIMNELKWCNLDKVYDLALTGISKKLLMQTL
jgi:A/G-specific adenine glycosylase